MQLLRLIPFHAASLCLLLAAHAPLAPGATVPDEDCMACHEELDVARDDGSVRSLSVDGKTYAASVHGQLGVGCSGCHADIEDVPHPEQLEKVDCGLCHDDAAKQYTLSVHGQSFQQRPDGAAECASCHGTHDVLPSSDPNSRVYHGNLAQTCIRCHEDGGGGQLHRADAASRQEGAEPQPPHVDATASSSRGAVRSASYTTSTIPRCPRPKPRSSTGMVNKRTSSWADGS